MIGLFQSTRAIILIILLLLLFGCGGGGGSNSENSSLKADAGPDSDVEEATLVTLDGTAVPAAFRATDGTRLADPQ
jgi:hypothetical protein